MWYNLSEEEALNARFNKIHCLVIYDIVDNRRRVKLSDLLTGFGQRVQMSCFECNLEPAIFKKLLEEIDKFYDPEELDNIIVYELKTHKTTRFSYIELKEDEDLLFF